MIIKILTSEQFDKYIYENNYNSIYQTSEYTEVMQRHGYDTLLLGLIDNDKVIGATAILIENRGKFKYAYAPRGFLIDYSDEYIVEIFTEQIKLFLSKMDIIAVKLSPMIIKNIYSSQKELIFHNEEYNRIFRHLKRLGYYHLGYNNYFEAIKPRFEAILDLSKPYYKIFDDIKKNFRTKIRAAEKMGIRVYQGDINNIEDLYVHTKKKYPKDSFYFSDIYTSFSKKNKTNLYYTKLDAKDYLVWCQQLYENQEKYNQQIDNEIITKSDINKDKLINKKLIADKMLDRYQRQLITATNILKEHPEGIITASILIITNKDTVYLYMDGYDKKYQSLSSKHILLWKLIQKYSLQGYKKFNLGGVINIFSDNEKYNGLNEFKLNFNPKIIEYLGDLELICNNTLYFIYKNSKSIKNIIKK